MVSDFIDEHDGFLHLHPEDLALIARALDPAESRELLEYGSEREGY